MEPEAKVPGASLAVKWSSLGWTPMTPTTSPTRRRKEPGPRYVTLIIILFIKLVKLTDLFFIKETKIKTLVPEMGEEDVRKAVEPLILEFFENNDSMEVLFTLQVSKKKVCLNSYNFRDV